MCRAHFDVIELRIPLYSIGYLLLHRNYWIIELTNLTYCRKNRKKTLINHSAEVAGKLNRLRMTSPETCDALFVLGHSRTTVSSCGRDTER